MIEAKKANETNKTNLNEAPSFVLVGAPNSGKTTLYNWLTASHYTTVNYPGSTVEFSQGRLAPRFNVDFRVIDSPGTYSIFPRSEDEMVTNKILLSGSAGKISGVVVVVDGTQIARQLLLADQVHECGFPMILVLTMADILRKEKINLTLEALKKRYNCLVVSFDGLLGGGLNDLFEGMWQMESDEETQGSKIALPIQWSDAKFEEKIEEAEKIEEVVLGKSSRESFKVSTVSQNLDGWLLHPIWGLLIFFVLMAFLFSSVFWMATPLMELIDHGFSMAANWVVALSPESLWANFLGNGLIASMGAVLIFLPQIFILFLGIGLLGDSGYLSRAATLVDKPLSMVGLSGRSFVPVLSGFACAVPAIMASRNLNSRRDRLITIFVLPLMTCSARLPVYTLLIGFLLGGSSPLIGGLFMAALYFGSIVMGAIVAKVLDRFFARSDRSFFVMELPLYRRPLFGVTLRLSLRKTWAYLKRAGWIIFIISTLIWILSNFPNYDEKDAAKKISMSYLGQAGQILEPVLRPMGVDWRVGVGLLSAFAAREVFTSTLAVVYNLEGGKEREIHDSLLSAMKNAKGRDQNPIFTVATVSGLIMFFMIALQCMSTFAVTHRETGSFQFALLQLVVFNVLAYVLAVVVVQGLRAYGIS